MGTCEDPPEPWFGTPHSLFGGFCELGVLFVVLIVGVYIKALDFWKLPRGGCKIGAMIELPPLVLLNRNTDLEGWGS